MFKGIVSKKKSWGWLLLLIPVLVFAYSALSNSDLVAQARKISIWYVPGKDTGSGVSCPGNLTTGNQDLLCQMRQAFTWQSVTPANGGSYDEVPAQSESNTATNGGSYDEVSPQSESNTPTNGESDSKSSAFKPY